MLEAIFLIMLLAPVAGIGFWKLRQLYDAATSWAQVGRDHGLEFSAGLVASEFTLSGTYRDVPVRVETVTHELGNPRKYKVFTRFRAPLPDEFPSTAVVSSSGGPELTDVMLAAPQPVHVDPPAIDDHFLIRADRPEGARAFFEQPGIADAFEVLNGTDLYAEMGGGELVLRANRFLEYAYELDEPLDTITACCRLLRDATAASSEGSSADPSSSENRLDREDFVQAWD